jgi:hypothetical protein
MLRTWASGPDPEGGFARKRHDKTRIDSAIALTGGAMFFIQGTDTSGSISLRRDTTAAAVKKAGELIEDGCWDVQITTPDGRVYASAEFEQLQSDAKT